MTRDVAVKPGMDVADVLVEGGASSSRASAEALIASGAVVARVVTTSSVFVTFTSTLPLFASNLRQGAPHDGP